MSLGGTLSIFVATNSALPHYGCLLILIQKETNRPGLHCSDCTPGGLFTEGSCNCCSGPWWSNQRLQICWAGAMGVVFLSFYNIWIWMTWGEACSFVHCKSHYVLCDSYVYITCWAPCHGRRNHRSKQTLRLNLFRLRRENTEENTILKQVYFQSLLPEWLKPVLKVLEEVERMWPLLDCKLDPGK